MHLSAQELSQATPSIDDNGTSPMRSESLKCPNYKLAQMGVQRRGRSSVILHLCQTLPVNHCQNIPSVCILCRYLPNGVFRAKE